MVRTRTNRSTLPKTFRFFLVSTFNRFSFHTGWLYCALGGACLFLLVQMVLVTEFARSVSLPRPFATPTCSRLVLTLTVSLGLTAGWLLAYAWLFIRYFYYYGPFFLRPKSSQKLDVRHQPIYNTDFPSPLPSKYDVLVVSGVKFAAVL